MGNLKAKLSFNDGYAERPIYTIKANIGEKEKGLYMIELIQDNFNISIEEVIIHRDKIEKEIIEEMKLMSSLNSQIFEKNSPLNRDEKGNLVSPFRSEKKLI